MSDVRSQLARHVPAASLNELELFRMRQKAWIERGEPCLPLDRLDGFLRRMVIAAANEMFGQSRVVK